MDEVSDQEVVDTEDIETLFLEMLLREKNLELRGLGKWTLSYQPVRRIYNPKIQKKITVAASYKIKFRPSKSLLALINQ